MIGINKQGNKRGPQEEEMLEKKLTRLQNEKYRLKKERECLELENSIRNLKQANKELTKWLSDSKKK